MRLAILSDIHANGDALEAVAREIERLAPDGIRHLGDLVGYNAEPGKIVRWAMAAAVPGVMGNHDAVACGASSGRNFNPAARTAALWSAEHLSKEASAHLAALPARAAVGEDILLVHGAPSDPDRYLFTPEGAAEEFDALGEGSPRVVFFGHTHVPAAFVRREDGRVASVPPGDLVLGGEDRAFLNPGSVGQPRDRDPRASFLLYDTSLRRARWIRVPYDAGAAARKVVAAGLPRIFAARLLSGT